MEGKTCGPIRHIIPVRQLEGLKKPKKYFNQDSQSLGKDLNPEPLGYEAGEIRCRQRRLD